LGWALLASASPLAAQSPARPAVALALEVSGGRIPGIEPYREIAADTVVTVPPGVRFVFQHYGSCRRFSLSGGVATFRADGVDVAGGVARPAEGRPACPRKLMLKDDGTAAAVTMRSLGRPRIAISTRPDFVIVGPRAGEFAALRVLRGSDIVIEQPLASGRPAAWPAGAQPLAADTGYELELLPIATDRAPLVIGFRTVPASAPDEPLTLVSAE